MNYIVTAIKVANWDPQPSDIVELRFTDMWGILTDHMTPAKAVELINRGGVEMFCGTSEGPRLEGVVPTYGKPYVRTVPNNSRADNLLQLPKY